MNKTDTKQKEEEETEEEKADDFLNLQMTFILL